MRRLAVVLIATAAVVLLTACGSSKPGYCGNLSKLQSSVTGLHVSGGVSAIKSQLQQIESNAKKVVSSAKGDFPSETTAIDDALSKLESEVKAIPSSPTPAQLAGIASGGKAVVDAVSNFASATKSKCK